MITKIYGASDDLIEIDGEITDEVNDYTEKPISISASDGTKASIIYDSNGEWKINVKKEGQKYSCLIDSVGDDAKHTHPYAIECSSYSDVLVFKNGIEWVKIGRKKFKVENR